MVARTYYGHFIPVCTVAWGVARKGLGLKVGVVSPVVCVAGVKLSKIELIMRKRNFSLFRGFVFEVSSAQCKKMARRIRHIRRIVIGGWKVDTF